MLAAGQRVYAESADFVQENAIINVKNDYDLFKKLMQSDKNISVIVNFQTTLANDDLCLADKLVHIRNSQHKQSL